MRKRGFDHKYMYRLPGSLSRSLNLLDSSENPHWRACHGGVRANDIWDPSSRAIMMKVASCGFLRQAKWIYGLSSISHREKVTDLDNIILEIGNHKIVRWLAGTIPAQYKNPFFNALFGCYASADDINWIHRLETQALMHEMSAIRRRVVIRWCLRWEYSNCINWFLDTYTADVENEAWGLVLYHDMTDVIPLIVQNLELTAVRMTDLAYNRPQLFISLIGYGCSDATKIILDEDLSHMLRKIMYTNRTSFIISWSSSTGTVSIGDACVKTLLWIRRPVILCESRATPENFHPPQAVVKRYRYRTGSRYVARLPKSIARKIDLMLSYDSSRFWQRLEHGGLYRDDIVNCSAISVYECLAEHGHRSQLIWLWRRSNMITIPLEVVSGAVKGERIKLVKWFLKKI